MWTLSSAASQALGQHHTTRVRITAYGANFGAVSELPIKGGVVTVDAGSQTRRTASIDFADTKFWPRDPFAVLSPLGSELFVEYGIVLSATNTEWIPLIRGPITDVRRSQPIRDSQAALTVTVSDRSLKIAEAKFDAPTQTVVGATTVAEIRRLITDILTTVTVTDLTGSAQVAAQLDIERERWADGCLKLAESLGAEVFATPAGGFVIRPVPTLANTPVWIAVTSDHGTVVSLDEVATREFAYSKVVASGQRTDGTPPVWAAVSDTDPLSPTYINGPFGTKTKFYSSPLLTTTGMCTTAATAILERSRGMAGSITMTMVPNPALEAGDVLVIRDARTGTDTAHIIDSVTIPLSAKDIQRITTRSADISPEIT